MTFSMASSGLLLVLTYDLPETELDVDAANGHAWVLTYDLPETEGQ